jgi:hypothetical protein
MPTTDSQNKISDKSSIATTDSQNIDAVKVEKFSQALNQLDFQLFLLLASIGTPGWQAHASLEAAANSAMDPEKQVEVSLVPNTLLRLVRPSKKHHLQAGPQALNQLDFQLFPFLASIGTPGWQAHASLEAAANSAMDPKKEI